VLRIKLPAAMGSGVLRAAMSATYALLIGSPRPASSQIKHALHQVRLMRDRWVKRQDAYMRELAGRC
jgi:hypothetical protein